MVRRCLAEQEPRQLSDRARRMPRVGDGEQDLGKRSGRRVDAAQPVAESRQMLPVEAPVRRAAAADQTARELAPIAATGDAVYAAIGFHVEVSRTVTHQKAEMLQGDRVV